MAAATRGAFTGVALGLLLVAAAPLAGAAMKFGMDPGAVPFLEAQGAKPDYAAFWAGPWNERAGWSYLGSLADQAADRGVTPVVHWYYWGGGISPRCVEQGCWDAGHWKDRARWNADAAQLAGVLHAALRGRPGVVVIETEFNKNGISTWDPMDGYLAQHAALFRQRAPELRLVLGFGNWQPWEWPRFDRAVAAMDMVGIQTMRASTRNTLDTYLASVDAVADAARQLHGAFPGKPVLLHDLALSTYATWAPHQERVVRELFQRTGELAAAGVQGVLYRALDDDPRFTLAEYFREGERHFGLRRADGAWKPALDDWIAGVKALRGGAPAGGTASPGVAFEPRSVGNDWWVEARVTGTPALARVEVRLDGGAWQDLPRTPWGTWARSVHAPDGTAVQFRAWDAAGPGPPSAPVAWGGALPTPPPPAFAATFAPRGVGNDWWVEAKVGGDQAVTLVEARVDGGPWRGLARTAWGTWARSLPAPDGSAVQFRAWGTAGTSALSPPVAWA